MPMKVARPGYLVVAAAASVLLIGPLAGQNASTGPTPRTEDGHPDLTGTWNGNYRLRLDQNDPNARYFGARNGSFANFERDSSLQRRADPNKPIYRPEFWEKVQQLDEGGSKADPSFGCMPAGLPRMGPPGEIVQTRDKIIFLYVSPEAQGWGDPWRIILMDGRPHTPLKELDGTWKGESIGHWEGDTLIVDTIGFNDESWLEIGGYFHTENMHVVERIKRDGDTLTWTATVEDPEVLVKPWTMNPRTVRLNEDPKVVLLEANPCSERDLSHLVTTEHH